jgi:ketosteroid isomerase-like protein
MLCTIAKSRWMALGVLAVMLPAAQPALARPHRKREAREEIVALESRWRAAEINNDIPAMDKLLSDDYLGITTHGDVLTKAQQLQRMRTQQSGITSFNASDTKIKLVGQVAIVTSLVDVRGSNDHEPLSGNFRYTRIYQHLPSGVWKITNFEITRVNPHQDAQ